MPSDESALEELYEPWRKAMTALIEQLKHTDSVIAPLMNPISHATVAEAINSLMCVGAAMQLAKDAQTEYLAYLRLDNR